MIYFRFIDDIFIASPSELDKQELCEKFPNLTLNIVGKDTVNFLDLNISYDSTLSMLNISLFIKPTTIKK